MRQHYGVMFTPEKNIYNSNAYWRHTYAVPFKRPTLPKFESVGCRKLKLPPSQNPLNTATHNSTDNVYRNRDPAVEICRSFRSIIAEFHSQIESFEARVNDTEYSISKLLHPELRIDAKTLCQFHSRNKRSAPLSFIGDLQRSIFGVATTRDIDTLASHVLHIESFLNSSSTAQKSYQEHLDSYIVAASDRFDNMNDHIDRHRSIMNDTIDELRRLTSVVQKGQGDINNIWQGVDSLIIMVLSTFRSSLLSTHYLEKFTTESDKRLNAVQTLLQGFLPIQLIKPQLLRATLLSISDQLRSHYPYFRVAHHTLFDHYKTPGVLFSHTENYLYIQVKVPLVHQQAQLQVYQIRSFTIPVSSYHSGNATKVAYTQVGDLPDYIAVTPDYEYYSELSDTQYRVCRAQSTTICYQLVTLLKSNSVPSCAVALLNDDHAQIKSNCNVNYVTNLSFRPSTTDLGQGRLLVQSMDTKWTRKCLDQSATDVVGCQFCVVNLTCGCELRSSEFYVPPSLFGCDHATTIMTVRESYNLPFITRFYDSPNFTVSHLYNAFHDESAIPTFSIAASDWGEFAQKEHHISADMNKLANMLKADDKIYYSPVDYLLDTSFHGFTSMSRYGLIFAQVLGFCLIVL